MERVSKQAAVGGGVGCVWVWGSGPGAPWQQCSPVYLPTSPHHVHSNNPKGQAAVSQRQSDGDALSGVRMVVVALPIVLCQRNLLGW
ncbi:unnamed protein product [Gadus morhua 'NCC']